MFPTFLELSAGIKGGEGQRLDTDFELSLWQLREWSRWERDHEGELY